jgi:hypothetical protein
VELCLGTTSLDLVGLTAAFWALATAFFLGFTEVGLGFAAALDSCFLSLTVLLLVVTVGFLGTTVTG